MAVNTAKQGEIPGRRMAFYTFIPFVVVVSTVNGEVLLIVIPGGRRPAIFGMAIYTGRRESGRLVIWIAGSVIIA